MDTTSLHDRNVRARKWDINTTRNRHDNTSISWKGYTYAIHEY